MDIGRGDGAFLLDEASARILVISHTLAPYQKAHVRPSRNLKALSIGVLGVRYLQRDGKVVEANAGLGEAPEAGIKESRLTREAPLRKKYGRLHSKVAVLKGTQYANVEAPARRGGSLIRKVHGGYVAP
jgi:hypothetical protein